MDEIIIEEKKYVSSKQAAKMTGYAKDYIGQLCREGRVPARLVGRSWYVLESAIQDHRFGAEAVEEKPKAQTVVSKAAATLSHWDSPRYEAAKSEFLPFASLKEDKEVLVTDEIEEEGQVEDSASLHESWREWFDHIAEASVPTRPQIEKAEGVSAVVTEQVTEAVAEEVDNDGEVAVPLRFLSPRPEREPLPVTVRREPVTEPVVAAPRADRRIMGSMKLVGALAAAISVVLAILGSGYVDEYVVTNSQAQVISGISVYNK
ncbi:MAG: helix-turn-helix domain-containing protein [Candidatus Paceibacterota bacterium]|jgi:hypothetical protein